jgi:hypothetical protein
MATREQLIQALRAADAAGNENDAIAIARMLSQTEETPASVSVGKTLMDIPRQAGLTARAGLSGALDVADLLASPIRGAMNLIPGVNIPPSASVVPDMLGLPQPQGANERTVQQGARLMAGGMATGGLAGLARPVSEMGRGLQQMITASPGMQAASGATAGLAQQSIAEAGGNAAAQLGGALLGGIAGGSAAATAPSVARAGQSVMQRIGDVFRPSGASMAGDATAKIDIAINQALSPVGVTMADLPKATREVMRNSVQSAMDSGGSLNPAAIQRMAQYTITGATPTRATVTQDPVLITQQKNTAKAAANSTDPEVQRFARIENENNQLLLNRLNELGADKAMGAFDTGASLVEALGKVAASRQDNINNLYGVAKSSSGRNLELEPFTFTQQAGQKLNSELKTKFLPAEIKGYLNDIAEGKLPLTVDVAEQLKTVLATAQRGAQDGNVRSALGIVRDALEETPLRSGQELGKDTIAAFNEARKANRMYKMEQERNPALKAVADGIEPDAFFQKFVVNTTSKRFGEMVGLLSEPQKQMVKQQIAEYLKSKATSSVDDIGRLSGIGLGKAMRQFGEAKLGQIFTPDEMTQLRAIAKVARYENNQPVGSAVNNSNTAPALMGMVNRLAQSSVLSKIPMMQQLVQQPAINISVGSQARQAMNAGAGLVTPLQNISPRLAINPATFGLLNLEE